RSHKQIIQTRFVNLKLERDRTLAYMRYVNHYFKQVTVVERFQKLCRIRYRREAQAFFFYQPMIRHADVVGKEVFLRDMQIMKYLRVVNNSCFINIAKANQKFCSIRHGD